MVERGRQLGLPQKAAAKLVIAAHLGGQKLQGRLASQMDVRRPVHHSHPTAPEHLAEHVRADADGALLSDAHATTLTSMTARPDLGTGNHTPIAAA